MAFRSDNDSSLSNGLDYPRDIKRLVVYQLERELVRQNLSRAQLAVLMNTSRAAINRLLDPTNNSVTLQTLERVSQALGKRIEIFLE